jgi:Leucine-rich repeat (LRR) protein
MTEITFALIRAQNPEVSAVENIEEIDSLRLNNCDIESIDNLELFHHISELYLSNNVIKSLENLSILSKLKILDVSNNKVTSESLIQSIPELPKTLMSINLSGNPCAEDEQILGQFQDAFPDCIIAIDVEPVRDDEEDGDGSVLKDEEEEEPSSVTEPLSESNRITNKLDADDVLKEIVERKCRLQNATNSFDLNLTVSVIIK